APVAAGSRRSDRNGYPPRLRCPPAPPLLSAGSGDRDALVQARNGAASGRDAATRDGGGALVQLGGEPVGPERANRGVAGAESRHGLRGDGEKVVLKSHCR